MLNNNNQEQDSIQEVPLQYEDKKPEIELLIKNDKFQEAEKMLTEVLEVDKANAEAFRRRADVYLKNGKYIQALHDMEKAMALDPTLKCSKSSYEHYQIKKGLMRLSNDI